MYIDLMRDLAFFVETNLKLFEGHTRVICIIYDRNTQYFAVSLQIGLHTLDLGPCQILTFVVFALVILGQV